MFNCAKKIFSVLFVSVSIMTAAPSVAAEAEVVPPFDFRGGFESHKVIHSETPILKQNAASRGEDVNSSDFLAKTMLFWNFCIKDVTGYTADDHLHYYLTNMEKDAGLRSAWVKNVYDNIFELHLRLLYAEKGRAFLLEHGIVEQRTVDAMMGILQREDQLRSKQQ